MAKTLENLLRIQVILVYKSKSVDSDSQGFASRNVFVRDGLIFLTFGTFFTLTLSNLIKTK